MDPRDRRPGAVFYADIADPEDGWIRLNDPQAALYAADAFARSSGRPALTVTRGLAAACQAASGLLTSWGDRLPVVVLNILTAEEEVIAESVYASITDGTFALTETGPDRSVSAQISAALSDGPVRLVHTGGSDARSLVSSLATALESAFQSTGGAEELPAPEVLANARMRIASFRKPALLVGRGALSSPELVPAVLALAHRWRCPILLTTSATTMPPGLLESLTDAARSQQVLLVPGGGLPWLRMILASDGILALGSALSEVDWFGLSELHAVRSDIVRVALDPADDEIATCFVRADATSFVRWLVGNLPAAGTNSPRDSGHWHRICQRWLRLIESEAEKSRPDRTIDPAFAAHEIVRLAPEQTVFISEGGACGMWLWSYLWLRPFVFPVQHGTIGVTIPMSAGVRAAHPGRPVWGVLGDGAFYYHADELASVRGTGEGPPPVFFVFNDSSWSAIRLGQTALYGGDHVGTDLPPTDYAALAACYGCEGIVVSSPAELTAALERARKGHHETPLVIDVRLRSRDHVPFSGASFVIAELDGALKYSAAKAAASFFSHPAMGAIPARAVGVIARMWAP